MLHVDDENDPWATMRDWVSLLPHGSYVAVTHTYNPNDGSPLAEQATARSTIPRWTGSALAPTFTSFSTGSSCLNRGSCPSPSGTPSGPPVGEPGVERLLLGGVGYKL